MKIKLLLITLILFSIQQVQSQENYKTISKEDSLKVYPGGKSYDVKTFPHKFKTKKPKNIILMIGDGMGVSQVFAGKTANHGHLFLDNFVVVGFSETQSADNYVTDSAAGGTALSTGKRTYNGAISVDLDSVPLKTVLEIAEEKGYATGLVSTSAVTHATPASFIAHVPDRSMYEAIALDFLKTDIDVFIGGGYQHFAERQDGKNLIIDLQNKGYQVLKNMDEIASVTSGKLAGLTAETHNEDAMHRQMNLPLSTKTAINILKEDKDGFFLMVEGSQIDWGGHQNNTGFVVEEMLDFDKAIGAALEFAAEDGETLIVVTADHETGGLSLVGGNMDTGMVVGAYTTGSHTAVMVPVFAYGPGAKEFGGIQKNSEIGEKMIQMIK